MGGGRKLEGEREKRRKEGRKGRKEGRREEGRGLLVSLERAETGNIESFKIFRYIQGCQIQSKLRENKMFGVKAEPLSYR